mmetsp:Transcript_33565/g.69002  ORF Transcript_33565/g.69002 Transcript_33565/m.69002 type:complete len:627 (-) Transcript_33565:1289-3169(-)
MNNLKPIQSIILIVLISIPFKYHVAASDDKCAADAVSFFCPNCGGIEVTDCTADCEGYLFSDYNHGICYDRRLFNVRGNIIGDPDNHYPFLWTDILGGIIWFITAAIAVPCGIGGGGIYVPVGILLLRFSPKASSGLSQASVFGACLGGLFVNAFNFHPNRFIRDTRGVPSSLEPGKIVPYEANKSATQVEQDKQDYLNGGDGKRKFYTRPLIDYDMTLFLAPMEMAGAVLGVTIQRLLPDWLYLLFSSLVFSFTSYKTYKKFFSAYKEDKARNQKLKSDPEEVVAEETVDEVIKHVSSVVTMAAENSEGEGSIESPGDVEPNVISQISVHDSFHENDSGSADDIITKAGVIFDKDSMEDSEMLGKRRQFLEEDSRQFPKEKMAYLGLLWAVLTAIAFLKGGKGFHSLIGITCEDAGFHLLGSFQFLWTFSFAAYFGYRNVKRTEKRLEVHYPFNETDILWTYPRLRYFSFSAFVAGFVAGLIGIGAGMFLGPILILNGVHPSISTATTATMIVLTCSSIAVMYVMSGMVPWEYATYFFLACMCGAYIGKTRVDAYVKRTGMVSMLIGALATIIAFATVGCVSILLMGLAKQNWCFSSFNQFCVVDNDNIDCQKRTLVDAEEMFPY